MLARIAHELFWLGRNIVRAEHTARMLDGVFQADLQGRPDDPNGVMLSWGSILAIMGGVPEGHDPIRPRRDEWPCRHMRAVAAGDTVSSVRSSIRSALPRTIL